MLKVTLLKVTHSGEAEAKKLLRHVKECDVFAPETAGQTEEDAVGMEHLWKRTLTLSRTRALFEFELWFKDHEEGNTAFLVKLYDDLAREKKPITYLERWSEGERTWVVNIDKESQRLYSRAQSLMLSGDFETFFDFQKAYLEIIAGLTRVRDNNIAENLETAEDRIRNGNKELSSIDPLNLAMFLGSSHYLERYTTMPITVVDFTHGEPLAEIEKKIFGITNASEWSKRDMLAHALAEQSPEAKIKVAATPEQIMSASLEELRRLVVVAVRN